MRAIKDFLLRRSTLIVEAILFQLVVLVLALIVLQDYFAIFYGGSIIVSSLAVMWIINNNSNPAYKIAWIIPILVFPILGGLFYIFFGGNKLSKRDKQKMATITNLLEDILPDGEAAMSELASKDSDAAVHSHYIRNSSSFPVYKNTSARYFPLGDDAFPVILEELEKAEHYIFLEFFIVGKGIMWDSILDILVRKAASGVDVRMIYDDFGCLRTLPFKYDKHLEALGIKCQVFNPLIPVLSPRHNHRDHRKLMIIDGYTGFTGGINLADEYINKKFRFGHWKDTAVMLKGEAVWSMSAMFLAMWNYLTGVDEDLERFRQFTKCSPGSTPVRNGCRQIDMTRPVFSPSSYSTSNWSQIICPNRSGL
jgi:cardiolipin synthase